MRRALAAVLLGTAILTVGCAGSGKPFAAGRLLSPGAAVRLAKDVRCFSGHRATVGPDAVRHFHAVTAVECGGGTRIYPGEGKWSIRVRKVAVGSVAGLKRYFEQRSLPPYAGACTLQLEVIAVPVFVDSAGRSLVPQVPVDGCHHPLGGFARAVRWHVTGVEKIRRLLTAPEAASGCDAGWGRPMQHSWSTAVFRVHRTPAHVCIYRTTARHQWVGSFVRGLRLDMAQTKRLVAALKSGGTHLACAKQSTFAEVITTAGASASVELGGCYRVNGGPGAANVAVVRAIIGSG
jgi:hypothetical protein